MNKIRLFFLAAVFMVMAGSASAQKTGYIRIDDVVRLMPETAKLSAILESYQKDSLQPRFNYTLTEYQRKDSIVNGILGGYERSVPELASPAHVGWVEGIEGTSGWFISRGLRHARCTA